MVLLGGMVHAGRVAFGVTTLQMVRIGLGQATVEVMNLAGEPSGFGSSRCGFTHNLQTFFGDDETPNTQRIDSSEIQPKI